jgi:hypothetical protein
MFSKLFKNYIYGKAGKTAGVYSATDYLPMRCVFLNYLYNNAIGGNDMLLKIFYHPTARQNNIIFVFF